jgi:hypothetical protein
MGLKINHLCNKIDHVKPIFKVKASSVHACTSPEGSRRLELPDIKTVGNRYSCLLDAE